MHIRICSCLLRHVTIQCQEFTWWMQHRCKATSGSLCISYHHTEQKTCCLHTISKPLFLKWKSQSTESYCNGKPQHLAVCNLWCLWHHSFCYTVNLQRLNVVYIKRSLHSLVAECFCIKRPTCMKFFSSHGVYLSRKPKQTHCGSHEKVWYLSGVMM